MEEALVCHFKHAADVGGLALVEKNVAGWCVCIAAILAFEKSQRDERIEKVTRGTRMQPQPSCQRFKGLRPLGKFGKDLHLNGAEQSF